MNPDEFARTLAYEHGLWVDIDNGTILIHTDGIPVTVSASDTHGEFLLIERGTQRAMVPFASAEQAVAMAARMAGTGRSESAPARFVRGWRVLSVIVSVLVAIVGIIR